MTHKVPVTKQRGIKLNGPVLKDRRLDQGKTLQQVAEKAGLTFSTVWRAENSLEIEPPNALAIAKALGFKLPDVRLRERREGDDAA